MPLLFYCALPGGFIDASFTICFKPFSDEQGSKTLLPVVDHTWISNLQSKS